MPTRSLTPQTLLLESFAYRFQWKNVQTIYSQRFANHLFLLQRILRRAQGCDLQFILNNQGAGIRVNGKVNDLHLELSWHS